MEGFIGQFQRITEHWTRSGDPGTVREQFRFLISGDRVAFYWQNSSFILFHKAPMGGHAFQVVTGQILEENGKVKIEMQCRMNKIERCFNIAATIAVVLTVLIMIFLKENAVIAIIILFPVVCLVSWLINRHNRKEAKWFLQDLVPGAQS
jgi:hypothetical protein